MFANPSLRDGWVGICAEQNREYQQRNINQGTSPPRRLAAGLTEQSCGVVDWDDCSLPLLFIFLFGRWLFGVANRTGEREEARVPIEAEATCCHLEGV